MSRKLVAYFSAGGVTAKVAETLSEAIGADIYEITPEVPYTKKDLNWMDKKSRSTVEMNDPSVLLSEAGAIIWQTTIPYSSDFRSGGMLRRPSSTLFLKAMT